MLEFTEKHKLRVEKLTNYIHGLIGGVSGTELLDKYQILENKFIPQDVLMALDIVVRSGADMEKIKTASNKLFNILYKNLISFEKHDYPVTSFLSFLVQDNTGIKQHLAQSKQLIKKINQEQSPGITEMLEDCFSEMLRFTEHYVVIQNIVFPEIESRIEQHGCLKILWSFQDDIIRNIKSTIELLKEPNFDLIRFNKISSKVYFNINTIIFREEYVLFPILFKLFEAEIFAKMRRQLKDFQLEYFDTSKIEDETTTTETRTNNMLMGLMELTTGSLTNEQLELIFNHLPIDITYVDENDEVKFYSDPKHRIFPRTISVIGRKVQNCHPHESVQTVNKILESFKNGEKDEAAFWIKMGNKYVLIKYFAIRDEQNNYKGVLETSQEISNIQKITGERRLLDW